MAEFKTALSITLHHEGGYSNDKLDMGGETYCGVASKTYPNSQIWTLLSYHQPIRYNEVVNDKAIDSLVAGIYYDNYWTKILGDNIDSQEVANLIFDFCVTSGKAKKVIQTVLGVVADGSFGNKTIDAINAADPVELLKELVEARKDYYGEVAKIGGNMRFIKGWIIRAESFA